MFHTRRLWLRSLQKETHCHLTAKLARHLFHSGLVVFANSSDFQSPSETKLGRERKREREELTCAAEWLVAELSIHFFCCCCHFLLLVLLPLPQLIKF